MHYISQIYKCETDTDKAVRIAIQRSFYTVLTYDTSISIRRLRSLCACGEGCDISISVLLMLTRTFSEDMAGISIKCSLIG